RGKADPVIPPRILHSAVLLDIEGDLARDSVHRQVAGDAIAVVSEALNAGAGKGDLRESLDVEEISRAQMRIALRVICIDARRIGADEAHSIPSHQAQEVLSGLIDTSHARKIDRDLSIGMIDESGAPTLFQLRHPRASQPAFDLNLYQVAELVNLNSHRSPRQ